MPVAALYKRAWYRGEVIAVNGNDTLVLLVDCGTSHYITKRDLRVLEQEFVKTSRKCCKGTLYGVKPTNGAVLWDIKSIMAFMKKTKDKIVYATVEDFENEYCKISLYDNISERTMIADVMTEQGLADKSDDVSSLKAILVSFFVF
jgi:Tudor domain